MSARIESLLEESYNERMHLLVFLKMAKPGRFMRFMVLAAQGVWCNFMFFAYLLSPRTVHRFVGYLEEEAVLTYTRQIKDLEAGRLPKWEKMQAPEIAIDYWNMPEGNRTMRDLLLYSTYIHAHRFYVSLMQTSPRRREQASRGQPHIRQSRSERGPQSVCERIPGSREATSYQGSCPSEAYGLGAS